MRRLEFWPDYDGGLLRGEAGAIVALEAVVKDEALIGEARAWLARYDDSNLDPPPRDEAWLAEGRSIFSRLHPLLAAQDIDLHDWEGYWGG